MDSVGRWALAMRIVGSFTPNSAAAERVFSLLKSLVYSRMFAVRRPADGDARTGRHDSGGAHAEVQQQVHQAQGGAACSRHLGGVLDLILMKLL